MNVAAPVPHRFRSSACIPLGLTSPLIVLLTSLVLSGIVALGTASAATSLSHVSNSSRDVAISVEDFRSSMRAELDSYTERYGSRLSSSERGRILSLIKQSDTDLRKLKNLVSRVTRWEDRGNTRRARETASQALISYEFAFQRAKDAIDEMTPILRPKLNVIEALEASSTLNKRMVAYEGLRVKIRSLK